MTYTPAKHMGAIRGEPTLIVIHSMEAPEKGETAEATARYFASGAGGRVASAHVCIDNNSEVDCVPRNRVAYAAPGANHNGYQIELAGYARQSTLEWADEYSRAMVLRAASRAADICIMSHIWPVYRKAADLKIGVTNGITTHNEVRLAYKKTTHTDPGAGFPMQDFCDLVKAIVNQRNAQVSIPMPPTPSPEQQIIVSQLQEAIFYTKIMAQQRPFQKGDGAANGRADGVKFVQQALNQRGATHLYVDGEFGKFTEDAIMFVEHITGREVTGQADLEFLNFLYP